MARYLTEKEIEEAKADQGVRDKIRLGLEATMDVGKMQPFTVDEFGGYLMERRVATEDAIRAFCNATGDLNPLYRNHEYARKSYYGGIIAPPLFLSAIAGFTGAGIRRNKEPEYIMGGMDAGCKAEWFKTIREGDSFTVVDIPTGVIDLTREKTPIQFLSQGNRIYRNQRDEVVAIASGSVIAMIAPPPKEKKEGAGGMPAPKMRRFTEDEVANWYDLVEKEEIRGMEPRFWEDVNENDELPPTHHVYDLTEYTAHMVGWGVGANNWRLLMRANKNNWRRMIDPESGLPDFGGLHMTDISAQRMGMPMANCAGIQMASWLGRMITNWMGDTGFLKKIEVQYRRPLWRSSMALCKGKIVKKYTEGVRHLVDLALSVEDHDAAPVIPNGTATVALPSKHLKTWVPL